MLSTNILKLVSQKSLTQPNYFKKNTRDKQMLGLRISQNKSGRQELPFLVLGHIFSL